MKIICIDSSGFFCKPDTALLRNNEPFYMPDFGEDVEWRKGRVVRLNRLAKCVAERFAHRCYDEMGVAADFEVRGAECEAMARAFDHSFAIGLRFLPCESDAEIDKHIASVSRFVTLKIGDLLFVPDGEEGTAVEGERVTVELNGETLLDFEIK